MNQCFKRKEKNMQKQIIIINGTGGSGKDTFVDFVSQYIPVYNFSSIDLIKEVGSLQIYKNVKGLEWLAEYGWQGQKTEKDRKFLSSLKSAWEEYNNLPMIATEKAIDAFMNSEKEIMFIHIREPKNIEQTIKTLGGGVSTLLIKRANYENICSNESDKNVDNYTYDYIIYNTSLEELDRQAQLFIDELNHLRKEIKPINFNKK